MTTEPIFVVDDSADYRFLLQRVFARFLPQYPVRFFASGTDFYQHLIAQAAVATPFDTPSPRLILMDLNMPGLTGYQTLLLVKESAWRMVPIVIMTSEGTDTERFDCYDAGANSFLVKPLGLDAMRYTLDLLCQYWLETNSASPPFRSAPSSAL